MKLRDLRFDLGLKKMMTEGPFSRSVLFKAGVEVLGRGAEEWFMFFLGVGKADQREKALASPMVLVRLSAV